MPIHFRRRGGGFPFCMLPLVFYVRNNTTKSCLQLATTPLRALDTTMKLLLSLTLCLVASFIALSDALASPKAKQISAKDLPKFNKQTQRWEKATNAEKGYPLYETALRNGPGTFVEKTRVSVSSFFICLIISFRCAVSMAVPFITRLTQADDYEQAVLKFQAAEKCSINEAQGNMGK
jgi:hypothetical protein